MPDEFTYIEVARSETAYKQLEWDSGERPLWWCEHYEHGLWQSHVWEFARAPYWHVITDLEDAFLKVLLDPRSPWHTGDHAELVQKLRRELFFNVPLKGEEVDLLGFKVCRTSVKDFLRERWAQAERHRASLKKLESYLNPLLLSVGEELAEATGDLTFLTGVHPCVGVPIPYLKALAINTDFYELRNLVADIEASDGEARRAAKEQEALEREARRQARVAKAAANDARAAARRFIGYLALDDFEPRNEDEQEAHERYKCYADAELTSVRFELKEALMEFVLQKELK